MTNFLKSVILKILCLVLFGLIPQTSLFAQATGNPKEDFLYGEYYVSQNLYQKALPFYLSALSKNPDNSNINYRVGQCFLRIIGSQENAIPYLEKAIENIDEHYVAGRYKDPAAPIEAWLFLGDAYHRENRLNDASKAYHQYRILLGDSDEAMYELVMQKISGLGISYEFQRSEDEIKLINLGSGINSRFSDYNPVLSGDQKTLVYTQFWESYDRIMEATLTPAGWTKPKDISTELNTQGRCYTVSMSYKGSELYLVCHEMEQYDIYVSTRTNGSWTPIKPISGKINSRWRESSASISADGAELYFSSDRPGGEGGFDIYKARKEGNEWAEIENMGSIINTDKNEEAPYLSNDGNVMYFSSNGHATIGNMDIIYSEMTPEGIWSRPVNMGSPVNTTSDEIFYVYFKETKTGYLSRDLKEGFGKNDIYIIQHGLVLNMEINPIIDTTNGILVVEMKKGNSIQPYLPKSQIRDLSIPKAVSQSNTPSYFQETTTANIPQTSKPEDDLAENPTYGDRNSIGDSGNYNTSASSNQSQTQGVSAESGVSTPGIVAGAVAVPGGSGATNQTNTTNTVTSDSEGSYAYETEISSAPQTTTEELTQHASGTTPQSGNYSTNTTAALNNEASQKAGVQGNPSVDKTNSNTAGNNVSAGQAAGIPAGTATLAPASSASVVAAGVVPLPGTGNNASGTSEGKKGRKNKNASVDIQSEQNTQTTAGADQYQETYSAPSETNFGEEEAISENFVSSTNSATSQGSTDDGTSSTYGSGNTSTTVNSSTVYTTQQQEAVKSSSQTQQPSGEQFAENNAQANMSTNVQEQTAYSTTASNNPSSVTGEASSTSSEYTQSPNTGISAGNTRNQTMVTGSSEIYYSEPTGKTTRTSATVVQKDNSNTNSHLHDGESAPATQYNNPGKEYNSSAGSENYQYTEGKAGNAAPTYQSQENTHPQNTASQHAATLHAQSDIEKSGSTAYGNTQFEQQGSNPGASNNEQSMSAISKSTEQGSPYSNYMPDYSSIDSIPTYTIQIYALQHPIPPNKIELSPLVVSAGADGLTRYTWGEFTGFSKALDLLDTIRRSGYPDAFIRNISTVENYGTKN